jgi:hypothetical protein
MNKEKIQKVIDTLMQEDTEADKENYDHPNDSKWIIGIDFNGQVFIIQPPNIHPSFLEYSSAEEIGLVYELPDESPGIYEMICSYEEYRDWESGIVEDYRFLCKELKPRKPLTDDEIESVYSEIQWRGRAAFFAGVRFAEEKHGITNPEQSKPKSNAI